MASNPYTQTTATNPYKQSSFSTNSYAQTGSSSNPYALSAPKPAPEPGPRPVPQSQIPRPAIHADTEDCFCASFRGESNTVYDSSRCTACGHKLSSHPGSWQGVRRAQSLLQDAADAFCLTVNAANDAGASNLPDLGHIAAVKSFLGTASYVCQAGDLVLHWHVHKESLQRALIDVKNRLGWAHQWVVEQLNPHYARLENAIERWIRSGQTY
ncbi:hypothetical protein DFJ74DRAFT_656800 [Hyaloraphidium curvatum]|nr:hypothetical protein DFJ74DRAFT_656800 [Hyaloraphidium curvatum]